MTAAWAACALLFLAAFPAGTAMLASGVMLIIAAGLWALHVHPRAGYRRLNRMERELGWPESRRPGRR